MRIALLTNILAPYRMPVLRSIAATRGWRLRIFTNAATEFDRSWQVDPRTCSTSSPPGSTCQLRSNSVAALVKMRRRQPRVAAIERKTGIR